MSGLRFQRWLPWALLGIGLSLLPAGVLTVEQASDVWTRVWPVLAFLIVIKVVADLFDDAGLFDVAVHITARWGRGSRLGLFALFVVVCIVATNVLSLDTTAVLLTPVALRLADELQVSRWPFALATLWLANTASLFLPVANLTNLIAQGELALTPWDFAAQLALPQLGILAVIVALLLLRHASELKGRYHVPENRPSVDRVPLWTSAVLTIGLAVAVLVGVAPWIAGAAACVLIVAVFALRRPGVVHPRRLFALAPWGMAAFALGLFFIVTAIVDLATPMLSGLLEHGDGLSGLMTFAAISGVAANVMNNLPAYLAIEPFATTQDELFSVLIGVNIAPIITIWGSLATLLWWQSCHSNGMRIRARAVAREGLLAAPVAVVVGVLLLLAH